VREKNNAEEVIAQGVSVVVCYDYAMHASTEVPEIFKERIMAFEGSL
jgi:acyl-CoA thioesterase FadM